MGTWSKDTDIYSLMGIWSKDTDLVEWALRSKDADLVEWALRSKDTDLVEWAPRRTIAKWGQTTFRPMGTSSKDTQSIGNLVE